MRIHFMGNGNCLGNSRRAGRAPAAGAARQRGVVLLITLVVLVAMMLAGIGMMRSIDTTTMISGNVAFREATLQAGDAGLNQAYAMLAQIASNSNDKVVLNYNGGSAPTFTPQGTATAVSVCPGSPALSAYLCQGSVIKFPGYYSAPSNACEIYPPSQPPNAPSPSQCPSASMYQWWTQPANWTNAPAVNVKDANGNPYVTVYYLIHRMCTCAGTAPSAACPSGITNSCETMQMQVSSDGSHSVGTTQFTVSMIYYRITTKSVGPRNTISYAQSLVMLPE